MLMYIFTIRLNFLYVLYDSTIVINEYESIIYIFSFVKNDAKSAIEECINHLKHLNDGSTSFKSYCCWISNIPENVDDLKRILSDEAIKFGNFSSIKIDFKSHHKLNQCFINYFEEDSATNAAKYFNKRKFYGNELKSTKKM